MKRFIALVLSLVMALSLCAPAYAEGETVTVANADQLVEALEAGKSVVFANDITIDPANMSNAYGTTGINVKQGQTIDGANFTLDIKGAGGTWDSGINTTGGTIKNITITGSFRGIFINHNSDYKAKVILENVTTTGTTYTISCDQGTNNGLDATNCSFFGWTSFAATLGDATFTNCHFGEGRGYAFMRPYAPAKFVGCSFEVGYEMDPRAAVTFNNCTLGDALITNNNLATLVTSNFANASVVTAEVSFNANNGTGEMESVTLASGETYTLPECGFTAPKDMRFKGWATSANATEVLGATHSVIENTTFYAVWEDIPEANVGGIEYTTLQAAVDAVADGGTITMLKGGAYSATVAKAISFTVQNEVGADVTITAGKDANDKDYTLTKTTVADGVKYTFAQQVVIEETETVVETVVTVVPPLVADVTVETNGDAEEKLVEELGKAFEDAAVEVNGDALTEVATEVATDAAVDEKLAEEAIAELSKEMDADVVAEDVTIVIQPYFDIEVTDVSVEGEKASFTVDITPMYSVIATTDASNIELDGTNKNAVELSKDQKMDIPAGKDVLITIAIPESMASATMLFVTHAGAEVYEATVADGKATFIARHGFSPFEFTAADPSVAAIGSQKYVSLAAAINGAKDGDTIKLLSDNAENVTVKAALTIDPNGHKYTGKVTAGNGYTESTDKNGVITVKEIYWGGYIPTTPADDDDKPIKSADTFDAGVALYAAVSVMSAMGAVVLGKKRED